MIRTFTFIFIVFFLTISVCFGVDIGQVFSIYRTSQAISIDGKLDEWQGYGKINFSAYPDLSDYNHTDVMALWDSQYLYVAYQVRDKKLNAIEKENKVGIWQDDCVELYLSINPRKTNGNYLSRNEFQFLANILASQYSIRGKGGLFLPDKVASGARDYTWQRNFYVASDLLGSVNKNTDLDSGYIMEMAIPWKLISYKPNEGDTLLADFCVEDSDSTGSWSGSFDWCSLKWFSQPSKWDRIILSPPQINTTLSKSNFRFTNLYSITTILVSLLFLAAIIISIYRNNLLQMIPLKYLIRNMSFKNNNLMIKEVDPILSLKNMDDRKTGKNGPSPKIVTEVLKIIENRYSGSISSEMVSKELNISVRHLQRVIKDHTDKTFTDLINEFRIQKAKELLENSADNISEIAYRTGFDNPTNFRVTFKKFNLISPNEYRKKVTNVY